MRPTMRKYRTLLILLSGILCLGAITVQNNYLTLTSGTYVWDDLRFPLTSSTALALTAPIMTKVLDDRGTGGTTNGVYAYGFLDNKEDDLLLTAQLPHGALPQGDIQAHVHWTMITTTTGNVTWGLECAVAPINGSYVVTVPANAGTLRSHTGTTARLTFTTAHNLDVGQNIRVASAGVGTYNGNFRVTAYSDTSPDFWIEYTTGALTEGSVAEAAAVVTGYTISKEVTATLSTNSQNKHLIHSIGTFRGARMTGLSPILNCRFYRPNLADINETIPALEVDFHFQINRLGSQDPTAN